MPYLGVVGSSYQAYVSCQLFSALLILLPAENDSTASSPADFGSLNFFAFTNCFKRSYCSKPVASLDRNSSPSVSEREHRGNGVSFFFHSFHLQGKCGLWDRISSSDREPKKKLIHLIRLPEQDERISKVPLLQPPLLFAAVDIRAIVRTLPTTTTGNNRRRRRSRLLFFCRATAVFVDGKFLLSNGINFFDC